MCRQELVQWRGRIVVRHQNADVGPVRLGRDSGCWSPLRELFSRRRTMERLIEAVAGDRVLITVVGRDQPHGFPFGRYRFVLAGMSRYIAVLREAEEPRQFRHLFAG